MLLDYDPYQSLYIFGDQNAAKEIKFWIEKHTPVTQPPELIDREKFMSLPDNAQCMIGFSNIKYRKEILSHPVSNKRRWVGFLHPESTISQIELLGKGIIIHPTAHIGWGVKIGDFCCIAPHCHVGHGAELGTSVVMSPGSIVLGATSVGSYVTMGAKTVLADRISIADDCEFLMSSVVTRSIPDAGRYVGNRKVPE